jgi:hypothetical protein
MQPNGHPDPGAPTSDVGAAKLFTVVGGLRFAPLAWPTVNNFG